MSILQFKKSLQPRKFARIILGLLLIFIPLLGGISCLVDPLWYFAGNQLTHNNPRFNERIQKMNRFLATYEKEDYDCLIFGSSRVTLLSESRIPDYNCFNFAFSSGHIAEYVIFAEYLKNLGVSPELVIIGLRNPHLFEQVFSDNEIPDFMMRGELPPPWWQNYFTISALRYDILAIISGLGDSYAHRSYDADFEGYLWDSAWVADAPRARGDYEIGACDMAALPVGLNQDEVDFDREMAAIFPEARYIAYAPTIQAGQIYKMYEAGRMADYLAHMAAMAEIYDAVFTFTTPHELTRVTDNTNDGSHYSAAFNDMIIERIFGEVRGGARMEVPVEMGVFGYEITDFAAYRCDMLENF